MKTISFDSWWYWQAIFVEKFLLTPLVYEKTVVVQRVRYSKKLAEKCSAALKSFVFMNDFDNFNEKCTGW